MDDAIPCRLCGYDAPGARCPHCDHAPRDPVVGDAAPGPAGAVVTGLRAVPAGLWLLARTRGVKRFLVPPLLLTSACFVALFLWIRGWVGRLLDAATDGDLGELGLGEGWLRSALEWLLARQVFLWLAEASGWIIAIVTSSLVALWTFSLAYEAVAGPFLDEIQGRLEERWFGKNPRNALQRPTDLPATTCAWITVAAGVPSAGLVLAWLLGSGGWTRWALLSAPVPFLVAATLSREYGKWLGWVVRVEGGTLWVSVKATLIAGVVLMLFLWLKLVPFVGFVLFAGLVGFTTALSLLDIPFSRRQWSLATRLAFLGRNLPAMVAYGSVAGLVFLVPVVGPVVLVPAASIGGLWLLVRLDKEDLRAGAARARAARGPRPDGG